MSNDGSVNILDVIEVAKRYGLTESGLDYEGKYDLDGDGIIGLSDLIIGWSGD